MPRTDFQRTVDGALTKELNSNQDIKTWMIKVMQEITSKLGNPSELGFFHVKGGTALALYLESVGRSGVIEQSDWDTQVVINPHLPPREWYEFFVKASETINDLLKHAQDEFSYRFDASMLEKIASEAMSKHNDLRGVRLALPEQTNSLAVLTCPVLHPLQYLDNAMALLKGVPEKEWSTELAKYFIFMPGFINQEESLSKKTASILKNFSIKDFYLYRLLVRYRVMNASDPTESTVRAELIDVSIPRRDTTECLLQWHHTRRRLMIFDGISIPKDFYYLDEQVQMVRENTSGTSPSPDKLTKRLKRGVVICEAMRLSADVRALRDEIQKLMPACAAYLQDEQWWGMTLHTELLNQFVHAYHLNLETEFAEIVANDYASLMGRIGRSTDAEQFFEIIMAAQLLSNQLEQHMTLRTEILFDEQNWKNTRNLIKRIYSASITNSANLQGSNGEPEEVGLAIGGDLAALLHLQSANIKVPCPVRTIELRIYHDGRFPLNLIKEIVSAASSDFRIETNESRTFGGALDVYYINVYWPSPVQFGQVSYSFLYLVIEVINRPRDKWPLLAYIDGLPVLAPLPLLADYEEALERVEEFGVSQRMQRISTELKKIVSQFW